MLYTTPYEQMLCKTMRVIAMTNDTLILTATPDSACSSPVCCQVVFGKRKTQTLTIEKSQLEGRVIQLGDTVSVALSRRHGLFAVLLFYGLPLMLLLVAAGVAHTQGYGDGVTALYSGLGMGLGFIIARCITHCWFSSTYLRIVS